MAQRQDAVAARAHYAVKEYTKKFPVVALSESASRSGDFKSAVKDAI
jgi:hypothetical protein